MKKLLLLKMSLVIALVGGVNYDVWADNVTMPTPVFLEDFESASISESSFTGSNSETGTLTGAGEIVSGAGVFGKYYQNEPTSIGVRANYLKINTTAFQTASIATNKTVTLSFWVSTTYQFNNSIATPDWNAMFEAYTDAGFTANTASTEYVGNVARAFDIRANASSHTWFSNYEYHSTHDSDPAYYRNVSWITKGWHHIAYVLADNSGTTHLKFYIDGTLNTDVDLAQSGDGTLWANLANITSYVLGGCAAEWADGDVAFGYDDIALYDVALTADQVNQIIDTKKAIKTIPSTFDFSTADAVSYQLNAPFDKGVVVEGTNVKALRFGSSLNPATAYFDCNTEKDGRQPYTIDANEAVIFTFNALHGNLYGNGTKTGSTISIKNSDDVELVSYYFNQNGRKIEDVRIGGVTVDNFPDGGFSIASVGNGFTANSGKYSATSTSNPVITITINGNGSITALFTCGNGSVNQSFSGTLGANITKDLAKIIVADATNNEDRAYAFQKLTIESKYNYSIKAVDEDGNELSTIEAGLLPYGETANKYWSKYIKIGDNWYVTSSPYGKTITENDHEANPVYTLSDIDYFVEGEGTNGYSAVGTSSGTDYSGGLTGRNGESAKWYTDGFAEAGPYDIYFPYKKIANSSNSTIKLYVRASDNSTTAIEESTSLSGSSGEYSKQAVLFPEGGAFQMEGNGYNSNYGLDYFTFTKSSVNYTLKYVNTESDEELTTVNRQAKWGSVITLAEPDKSVTVEDVEYGYVSDDLDNTTVAADGSTVVTIAVNVPCENPVGTITSAVGTSRKFTLTSATDGATIYYSETEKAIGDDGWLTYSSEVTTSASTIWTYAAKTNYPTSEVVSFATGAGTTVALDAPAINRTANNTITISATQTVLGTPTATIYYRIGESGEFAEYSAALNVSSASTVYAYASATGYDNSTTASREVNFVANNVVLKESVDKLSGYTSGALGTEAGYVGAKTTYYPLIIDGSQWGTNIYFQNSGWGFRPDNTWYNNGASSNNSWLLFKNMKKDDIVVIRILVGALATVNATYSEKYSYSGHFAYVVDEDGDVELRFQRGGSSPNTWNNTLFGIDQYTTTLSGTLASSGYSSLASGCGLDFSNATGLTAAYVVTNITKTAVTLTSVGELPGNQGVILKGTGGTAYSIPVKADAAYDGTNKLYAAVEAYNCAANEVYILQNGLFHLVTAASTVPAGKAYLKATDVPNEARSLGFLFGDDEVTSINSVSRDIQDGEFYNLQGQRVDSPKKGLYIVNGKKVIIK